MAEQSDAEAALEKSVAQVLEALDSDSFESKCGLPAFLVFNKEVEKLNKSDVGQSILANVKEKASMCKFLYRLPDAKKMHSTKIKGLHKTLMQSKAWQAVLQDLKVKSEVPSSFMPTNSTAAVPPPHSADVPSKPKDKAGAKSRIDKPGLVPQGIFILVAVFVAIAAYAAYAMVAGGDQWTSVPHEYCRKKGSSVPLNDDDGFGLNMSECKARCLTYPNCNVYTYGTWENVFSSHNGKKRCQIYEKCQHANATVTSATVLFEKVQPWAPFN